MNQQKRILSGIELDFPTLSTSGNNNLVIDYFKIQDVNSIISGVNNFHWHGNNDFFSIPFSNQSLISPNPNYQIIVLMR